MQALIVLVRSWIGIALVIAAPVSALAQQAPTDPLSRARQLYNAGNYDEAVKHLERAVELKPDDPTINDHLGDGYWKTGRFLEAQFQWSHAKDLKPEPEELEKIQLKLKNGLAEETSSAADASKQKKPGNGG